VAARTFGGRVAQFLGDAPRFQLNQHELKTTLASWRDASISLEPLIDRSPSLEEVRPLSRNLADLGTIGLEALAYFEAGITPSVQWRDAKLVKLDEAAKPKAALEFVVISSVRRLVVGASELSQLKSTTAVEWTKRVIALSEPVKKQ
jgi:hypothetical protein